MTDTAPTPSTRYVLCLFVTGASPRSVRAIRAVRDICDERLAGRYDLEVVDIYRHPQRAREDQVVGAPTLVKSLPLPVRRIIGDMSNGSRLASGLGLIAR
ncbi:circadian clock KaiB family protein [Methylosinus sp. Sm6]|uniref:circadian clock KaiB family protein n=1 Tax=Methylosinus sp. Sm6 TaxID=2866948 RepID=UPI001C992BAE|nr:circadian clock KaiB family protein [Methylosinus sp. Sm6]MBY6240873.1 circadian clock KaiB family protein [Methylosinus sp. Sm6]